MGRFAGFVEMGFKLQQMESPSLPAMNALSLFADPAMSMREERVIRPVLIAKPDTSATKVPPAFPMVICRKDHTFPYNYSKEMAILQEVQE